MQIKLLSLVKPIHTHDCESCKFMGAVKFGRGQSAIEGDVYVCTNDNESIIFRTGTDGDYRAFPRVVAESIEDDLWQAIVTVANANRKPAKWNKELVRDFLKVSDAWVVKGVSTIYKLQTEAEKVSETTTEDNGVGFNSLDAELLSSFAKGINKYGSLTPGQMVWARKKMLKYSGQLAKIANGEI